MMKIFFFLFVIVLSISCSNEHKKNFEFDKMHMFFPSDDSVFQYIETDIRVINAFREVLNDASEERKCSAEGEIRFLNHDSLVFIAGFATNGECQYIMRSKEAWRLNYRAGRFLEEIQNSLLSKK